MNCEATERLILLAETGELSAAEARELEAHLAGCSRCRAYRADGARLAAAARPALAAEPSPFLVTRVIEQIQAVPVRQGVPWWVRPGAGAMALAATILLAVMAWFAVGPAPAPAHGVSHLHTLAALLSEDTGMGEVEGPVANGSAPEALQAFAQELLRAEGLAAESSEEDFLPDNALLATEA